MEVIGGTDISGEVLRLIDGAQKVVILVSPYFDPWARLDTAIRSALGRPGMKVVLVLRGGVDRAKQEEKAQDLRRAGVLVTFLDKLHAKAYVSESQAILTSMNLLQSSALNSWELAVRVTRGPEPGEYEQVLEEVRALLRRADQERELEAKGLLAKAPAPKPGLNPFDAALMAPLKKQAPAKSRVGSCIRCGDGIPFNPERPLCGDCYASWAKFANADYKENHCHACGKERSTTFAKPLCRGCWEAVG